MLYNIYILNTFSDKRLKSRTAEATTLLQNKERPVELLIKGLEQEFEINKIKKTKM